ncbi:MAG TPA: alkaline phosphatase PhoX [Tepidisphaeraceae bacterium]|nr:alkaline phosphatase PhoX [Tepidisphaeraceae bacterium]
MSSMPAPSAVSRRSFLRYVGAGTAGALAGHVLGPLARAASDAVATAAPRSTGTRALPWLNADGSPAWQPVSYPIPIASDGGSAATDAVRLAEYAVRDDIVLPAGYRYDVIAAWGDTFGPVTHQVRFGHAADYTGLVPIAGTADEFWLLVNHEYISARPWLAGYERVFGQPSPVDAQGRIGGARLAGCDLELIDPRLTKNMNPTLLAGARQICESAMSDLGVSVLRVRRTAGGSFNVVADSADHFRFAGASAHNANASDMSFTGPAAAMLGQPRGTYGNCSGATTPWGTFLTCEENFQDQSPEFITPAGQPLVGQTLRFNATDDRSERSVLPFEFSGLGTGLQPPLDGRQYGWVVEIDPVQRTLKKHTALGRFRHENVALRCETGHPLVAYMGDDRRGGHVWKFVSDDVVTNPADPHNSQLLEKGTLYVARFEHDGDRYVGRWVPLQPLTHIHRPEPQHCSGGRMWLPARPQGGHVEVTAAADDASRQSVDDWMRSIAQFAGGDATQLMSLVEPPAGVETIDDRIAHAAAVICMDAYAMANVAGGTPCSRPEDVEVHPVDRSVYIAFTDSTGSGEGSPDVRIFPDSRGENSRQYGAIYRLMEDDNDPAALTFTWGRFVESGEMADHGQSFACADNLTFDPAGNLWVVTDITTPLHNNPVTRQDKTRPGEKGFVGVFGNNALFMIPTSGASAGVPHCFAIGPMDSEMTGPTFTADGRTLLLSIQHPGELNGVRGQYPDEVREMRLVTRDGSTEFTQRRQIPIGSNFPSLVPGDVPRPCVVAITRHG